MRERCLLAYDADCGACRSFKALVGFLDGRRRIEFSSLEAADRDGRLESTDRALRYRSFHLVATTGEAWSGAEAFLPLLERILPGGAAIARFLASVPGSRRAISFGYSTLSRMHAGGACGSVSL